MTPPMAEGGIAEGAWSLAQRAARAANVQIRQIDQADIAAAQAVISKAWGRQQVPQRSLLQALSHAGSTVLAAVHDGVTIGVAFGFLGWSRGIHLHSHMAAVSADSRSHGIGYALKLWQRALCLDHDVSEMRWTYDPLIARNAYFNLAKLGAEAEAFLPDFYGVMDDEVNAGDHSDRFEVLWRLDSRRVVAALHQTAAPHLGSPDGTDERVALPEDFDGLRRRDLAEARKVRLAARGRFTTLFAAGLRPEWADGGYRFIRPAAAPATALQLGGSRG